jgi:hypothetical protein
MPQRDIMTSIIAAAALIASAICARAWGRAPATEAVFAARIPRP